MVINTNVEAEATKHNLAVTQTNLAKSLSRLSSGSKIVTPSDDAAGLAVSNRLEAQVKRIDSALSNVVNATSWTQTQDGFMKNISTAFRRMSELAMLAQDSTKSNADRDLYNKELQELKNFIADTSTQDYNGVSMFAGVSLDVTVNSEGTTFGMASIDLGNYVYTRATNSGADAWKLSTDAYQLSKDGFTLKNAGYKTSVDLWRDSAGNWSKIDNEGTKIKAGSVVTEDVTLTDDNAKVYAAGTFVTSDNQAVAIKGFQIDSQNNQLILKEDHGLANGDAFKFNGTAPTGLQADTTYYAKKVDGKKIEVYSDQTLINKVDLYNKTALSGVSVEDSTGVFTKQNHGLSTGDSVIFNDAVNKPAGATLNTTYFVEKVNKDTFKLHTTAANAKTPTPSAAQLSTVTNGGAANKLTLADHTFSDGDAVRFSGAGITDSAQTPAAVTNTTTTYYVKKAEAAAGDDKIELYTKSDLSAASKVTFATGTLGVTSAKLYAWNQLDVTADATGLKIERNTISDVSADANTDIWTKSGHGLIDGDVVQIAEAGGASFKDVDATVAAANTLKVTGHGFVSGDAVRFAGTGTTPSGTDTTTTYYVERVDADNVKLHATDALGGAVTIATGATNGGSGALLYAYKNGESATANEPVMKANSKAFNTGSDAHVKRLSNTTFELYMTKLEDVAINADSTAFSKTSHGFSTGDEVQFLMSAPTGASYTASYFVNKTSNDAFTLHTTNAEASANTNAVTIKADYTDITIVKDKIDVDVASTNGIHMRMKETGALNVDDYSVTAGKHNTDVVKRGYFVNVDPSTNGEDANAIKISSGEIVSINQSDQDISSFAVKQNDDYKNINVRTVDGAKIALTMIKLAITKVATDRAGLGATQSRLNFTNDQLNVTKENLSAAISRIADVDVAEEATRYARFQILVSTGTQMLKQANQLPSGAVELLR